MFLSIGMLFCLEEHMPYRVARSTYLTLSQGLPYTVARSILHGSKVYLTGLQEVKLQHSF